MTVGIARPALVGGLEWPWHCHDLSFVWAAWSGAAESSHS